jgi:MurNAc alpha-1-phosphate uridylyltransferase
LFLFSDQFVERAMKAMILAAGRGERMRPLTDTVPKPLLSVGGRPLIEHHIDALACAGIQELVVNLSWCGDQIRDFLGNGSKYGLRVAYSDEGPEALETGGGIYHALSLLGSEPFWLVNGDVYCEFRYTPLNLETGVLGHLVMVSNPDHHPDGDFCLEHGRVRSRGGNTTTYSGLAFLHPGLFKDSSAGKFPLAPLLIKAMNQDAMTGEHFDGLWVDVGTPGRLGELNQILSSRHID